MGRKRRKRASEYLNELSILQTAQFLSRDLYERWQRQLSTGRFKGSKLERVARFYFMLRSCFYGHVEKGWGFALKTAEASRLYNCIGEVEAIAGALRGVHIDHIGRPRERRTLHPPEADYYARVAAVCRRTPVRHETSVRLQSHNAGSPTQSKSTSFF